MENETEEPGKVDEVLSPVVKTEPCSHGVLDECVECCQETSDVCIKEEAVTPTDIKTFDFAGTEEDGFKSVDSSQQQLKENPCCDIGIDPIRLQNANSLDDKPFPVGLYKHDGTVGTNSPLENSLSTPVDLEYQFDSPEEPVDFEDTCHARLLLTHDTSCADLSTKLQESLHGEKPYHCTLCSYSTLWKGNMRNHILTHTGEKAFTCSVCPYRCATKGSLKSHEGTHTFEKPYKCSSCPYRCREKHKLKMHERTHTGEKPHQCPSCPYSCAAKNKLKIHEKTHSGEKPYKCPSCTYRCALKDRLKLHQRTHTGEKPYKCSLCPYNSALKAGLKVHAKTHTGEKPFKCPKCPYRCAEKGQLKRHMTSKRSKCSLNS